MSALTWDEIGTRVYETGVDRGVLYLPNGSAVPWNGLTSVDETFDKEVTSVYYDGVKISDLVSTGSFAGSMKALTYPDEFVELEGLASSRRGIFFADQKTKQFGLSYRTRVGNDVDGGEAGYKIHLLYNVTAIPKDRSFETANQDVNVTEFEWDITAVPEEVPNMKPTAHVVIDSRTIDPFLLEDIEALIYGNDMTAAALMDISDLYSFMNNWTRIKIVDNGDGTWTAIAVRDSLINFVSPTQFEIAEANATYSNANTYTISDTLDLSDVT